MDDPSQMAFDIMELRAYARAKEALDTAKNESDVPKSAMVEQVWAVMLAIQQGEGK